MKDLLLRIHSSKRLTLVLLAVSHLVSALSVAAFGYMCYLTLSDSVSEFIKLALTLALPFLAITLLRKLINAPRPYELYDVYDTAPKNKKGSSFPSRHAHSAFAIGTLLCFFSLPLGIILLALALLLSAARVLLGIHFVRDVLAGALTGVGTAIIGILIFF